MMEDKTNKDVVFYKERSYKACMVEGLRWVDKYAKTLFRALWIPALVLSVICAAAQLCSLYVQPKTLQILHLVLALVALVGQSFLLAILFSNLNKFIDEGSLLEGKWKALRKTYFKIFPQTLYVQVIQTLVIVAWTALTAWLVVSLSPWLLIVLVIVLVYLLAPISMLAPVHLLGNTGLWKSFRETFSLGTRYYGLIIVVVLLSLMLLSISSLIFMSPSAIMTMAIEKSEQALAINDPSDLPGIVPYLMFILSTLGFFLSFLGALVIQLPYVYAFASMVAKRNERLRLKEEMKQLEREQGIVQKFKR